MDAFDLMTSVSLCVFSVTLCVTKKSKELTQSSTEKHRVTQRMKIHKFVYFCTAKKNEQWIVALIAERAV
jgi:Na+/melibiose symporter-like transporter